MSIHKVRWLLVGLACMALWPAHAPAQGTHARTLGINSTPTFVIGEKIVPGAISLKKLKRLIATARDIGGSVCVGFGVTLDASPLRAWRIVRCLLFPSVGCAQERNLQICGTYQR